MQYLFDTNICIYLINEKYERLISKVEQSGLEQIAISTITIAELEYGIAKSKTIYKEKNKLALMQFLLPFKILDFGQNDAYQYGRIRSDLQARGEPIGNMDMLLAAQAVSNNLILVTNNLREFKRISGIKLENWLS